MNSNDFRDFGHASIEFLINYLENIRDRNVLPSTTPYSLVQRLPKEIPEKAEHWKSVLEDMEHIILPGLAHWQSPRFHAYYPSSSSAGSIIGELLIAGIGVLGFSWIFDNTPAGVYAAICTAVASVVEAGAMVAGAVVASGAVAPKHA